MGGNDEGKQQKQEMVSECLRAGQNQQATSATPLGDATCASWNVENCTARKDMIEEPEELNSAGVIKLQAEGALLDSEGRGTLEVGCLVNERSHDPSGNVIKTSPLEDIIPLPNGVGGSNATSNSSCHICAQPNRNIGPCSESLSSNPSRTFHESGIKLVEVEVIQNLTNPPISQQPNLAVSVEPVFESLEICPEDGTNCPVTEQFELPVEVVSNLYLETPAGKPTKNLERSGRRDKRNTTRVKKKYMLRSSHGNKRSLRSRVGEKSKVLDSNDQTVNTTATEESKRTRRKKKKTRKVTEDEYSRIRKNLSYILNRIGYERSLIDAYSSEGWKGLRYVIVVWEENLNTMH